MVQSTTETLNDGAKAPYWNGIETTYTYDGNNLRTSKTSGGSTTEFLYDGVNIVGEKTNTDVKTYIRGKEILLDSDGIFYHHDTHGSVSALVNAQNEVLAQNTYGMIIWVFR